MSESKEMMDKVNNSEDDNNNVVNSVDIDIDHHSNELKRNLILKYEDMISKQLHDFIKIHRDQIMTPIVW